MKICAYVQRRYAKQTYKNESLDTRMFVGLRMIINELEKAGYPVEYAGIDTVADYRVVLVSITALCDWWSFLAERQKWRKGEYCVVVGGAGVLNVAPFLPWFDFAVIGRGENIIVPLIKGIQQHGGYEHESVVDAKTFSPDKRYMICQAEAPYPDPIQLHRGEPWKENKIGCNHRCLFCSYTWSRKQNFDGHFEWDGGGVLDMTERECALLDYHSGAYQVNWKMLRTTAIDGCSERLRTGIGKPIMNAHIHQFLQDMLNCDAKPHIIRFFNIVGLPTETEEDWREVVEVFRRADTRPSTSEHPWRCVLENNPFIPYPATPMACAPAAKENFRNAMLPKIAPGAEKRRLYAGQGIHLIESETVECLATIMLNMVVVRGSEKDIDGVSRLAITPKFWSAHSRVKEATLEKYFPLDAFFGAYTTETLPTRYLRTYAGVEKMWGKTRLERQGGAE